MDTFLTNYAIIILICIRHYICTNLSFQTYEYEKNDGLMQANVVNEKIEINVNTVLHADHTVFLKYKRILKSIYNDDDDSIEVFLTELYKYLIFSIDYIYRRFSHPHFKIKLTIIDIRIHKKVPNSSYLQYVNWFDKSINGNSFFRNTSLYINEFYNGRANVAHSFFVTDFIFDTASTLGLSYAKFICAPVMGASINRDFSFRNLVEIAAHELGHNIGMHYYDAFVFIIIICISGYFKAVIMILLTWNSNILCNRFM